MPTVNVASGITRIQDASDFSGTPSDGQIPVFGSGVFAPADRFPFVAPGSPQALIKNASNNTIIGIDASGNPYLQDNSGGNSVAFRSIGYPQILSTGGGVVFDDAGSPQLLNGTSLYFVRYDAGSGHVAITPSADVNGDLAATGNASAANLSNTNTGDKPSAGSMNDVQLANGSGGFSAITGVGSSTVVVLDGDGVTTHTFVFANGVATAVT